MSLFDNLHQDIVVVPCFVCWFCVLLYSYSDSWFGGHLLFFVISNSCNELSIVCFSCMLIFKLDYKENCCNILYLVQFDPNSIPVALGASFTSQKPDPSHKTCGLPFPWIQWQNIYAAFWSRYLLGTSSH